MYIDLWSTADERCSFALRHIAIYFMWDWLKGT